MRSKKLSKGIILILLIGMVSLFADFTYEGAWSILPQYLTTGLGLSVFDLGIVVGLAEFLGYAIRLASGSFVGRSKDYWKIMFSGYAINLFAVPLLALTGNYIIAIALVFAERMGKGIRVPPRDYIISEAAKTGNMGKAFAIEEGLDQVGAVVGPLVVSLLLFYNMGFRSVFAVLVIPALLSMSFLTLAYNHYKKSKIRTSVISGSNKLSKRQFLIYSIGIAISAAGVYNIAFVLYKSQSITAQFVIPLIFLVAMIGEGLFGFLFGLMYDKVGKNLVYLGLFIAALIPLSLTNPSEVALFTTGLLIGAATGVQDTVMRAVVGEMVSKDERAYSFGVFNAFYGFGLLAAGVVIGAIYYSATVLIIYVFILQLISAIMIFIAFTKNDGKE